MIQAIELSAVVEIASVAAAAAVVVVGLCALTSLASSAACPDEESLVHQGSGCPFHCHKDHLRTEDGASGVERDGNDCSTSPSHLPIEGNRL